MPEIYMVGGCVRDSILGLTPKDTDFVYVSDSLGISAEDGFCEMKNWMSERNFSIFLSNLDCLTIRAKFPASKEVADFVLARREIGYEENSRKPACVVGNLYDDLERRDFTVNALARNSDQEIIDFFNGQEDLKAKILRTPKNPQITFNEDPLRLLRAIRFKVVLDFELAPEVEETILAFDYTKMKVVSVERIREELHKMFSSNTHKSFYSLSQYKTLTSYIFDNGIKLLPSLKQK